MSLSLHVGAALDFLFFHDEICVRMKLKVKIYRILVDHVLRTGELSVTLHERCLFVFIMPVLDAVIPPF